MIRELRALPIRHPTWTLAAAGVLTLLGVVIAGLATPHLSSALSDYDDPGSAVSNTRQRLIHETGIDPEEGFVLLVRVPEGVAADRPPPEAVTRTVALLRGSRDVKSVTDYKTAGDPAMISRDGRATYVLGAVGKVDEKKAVRELRAAIAADPMLRHRVTLGGPTAANVEIAQIATKDLATAESVALPVVIIGLLFVFRGVIAAAIPVAGAVFSVFAAFLALAAAMLFGPISIFAINLVTALGMGLAVDFSLLIIVRYREESAVRADAREALERTMATSGRTVAFSAATVAASMSALLIFPQPFLFSMGLAGAGVAVAAALFALLVIPAALRLLDTRLDALAPRSWHHGESATGRGRWYHLAHRVMRRPLVYAVGVTALLVLTAAPFSRVTFSGYDASILPSGSTSGQVFHELSTGFANTTTAPVTFVVTGHADLAPAMSPYAKALGAVEGVRRVTTPREVSRNLWTVDVALSGPPLSDTSRGIVHRLRAVPAPGPVGVLGQTARFDALLRGIADRLPLVVVLMALLNMFLVFAMTRSVPLPLKNVVMNLMTIAATFGILILIFQWGWFGLHRVGTLEVTSLVIVGVLVSGLSTDYGVFLLSRIKEERDAGAGNTEAVAIGLERTGPVVSAAATLLFVPLFALVLSRLAPLRELGLGAALAVLIDATLVRGVLVPSLMALVGGWNWYSPFTKPRSTGRNRLPRGAPDMKMRSGPGTVGVAETTARRVEMAPSTDS